MGFVAASGRTLEARYVLREQLGEGGMGTVWRADHVKLKTPVAVKLISPSMVASEEARARFLREAQVAGALESPNIVRIFDFGVEDDTPYIAMELLQGETLGSRLARGTPLSPADTARVVAQIARGIGRAHQANIVHCDLKPENVFLAQVDGDEIAKVLDFGIAKAPTLDPLTKTGAVLGTLQYMSPEQLEGRKGVSARTDLYSLAVIAFECLCGRPAFKADSIAELVRRICNAQLPIPSEVAPVPPGFDDWFKRAAHRDPASRFVTAREMSDALSSLTSPHAPAVVRSDPALEKTVSAPSLGGSERAGYRVTPHTRERLFELELWGMWDMTTARRFEEEVREAQTIMSGSPYVRLVLLRNHPPQKDDVQDVKRALMSETPTECVRGATVVSSTLSQMQVRRLMTEGGSANIEFFEDEAQARKWLADTEIFARRGGDERAGFIVHPNRHSRVLKLEFWGLWNMAIAQRFRVEVTRAYDEMGATPFVCLSQSRRYLPQKEDVQAIHREVMGIALRSGLVRVAVLVDTALSQMQIRRLFEEAGSPPHLRFFTDEAAANAWLDEVIHAP